MTIELLVQILGGLFGFGIAYALYRIDKSKHDRISAEQQKQHGEDMKKFREEKAKELALQKERTRNNK